MTIERHPLVVSRVVGDVLEPFTATAELRVFSDGRIIYNGSSLRPSQVAGRPRVEIGDSGDFRTFYTLVMVDADAPNPSNPHFKEYLHWLVTDIPGSTGVGFGEQLITVWELEYIFSSTRTTTSESTIIKIRKEVVSYESPQPSMGIHRLVLALFRQAARQTVNAPIRRQNFNTREFSQLHNLGSPVAAVYYNCHRENGTGGRRA